MKKFFKNAVNEIGATKTFFEAGFDISKLKEQRNKLNMDYAEIVKQHENYKKFSIYIDHFKSLLSSQILMKSQLKQIVENDKNNIYLTLIEEIDKNIESLNSSLKIVNFDMNDEKFATETEKYNKELNEIQSKLTNAREKWH